MLAIAGRQFIDGQWVDPSGTDTLVVENPATEQGIATSARKPMSIGALTAAVEAGRSYRLSHLLKTMQN
ncbi:hypothetical protein EN933_29585 [Mesorhizobium sp. M7A.F.Ca.US.001.01.1.1]|nr:hypothetical protein EN933_29585 [Mesorhizobium sp. M7A.F.Ca.US.001.01.1.1]